MCADSLSPDFLVKPHGIVVCGGKSTRMGKDKSELVYHGVAQHIYVCKLLSPICDQVAISCNEAQFKTIKTAYPKIPDLPEYSNHGPISAVLTAFRRFPDKDLLVIGCDYPLLEFKELRLFLKSIKRDSLAAAFYNQDGKYEPMLAWYSAQSRSPLETFFQNGDHSLQHFLTRMNAEKYIPQSKNSMISSDTREDFEKISLLLSQNN